MADADLLIEELSAYLKPQDVEHVRVAIEFSRAAHQGQMRQSGDPYISHPIAVARVLAPLHIDAQAIIAALLHDVVEDTGPPPAKLEKNSENPTGNWVGERTKRKKTHLEPRKDPRGETFPKWLRA